MSIQPNDGVVAVAAGVGVIATDAGVYVSVLFAN
jgi:hypothetical protein